MIHGDLKPENILIRRSDMRVKLIDFGFAQIASEEPFMVISLSFLSKLSFWFGLVWLGIYGFFFFFF